MPVSPVIFVPGITGSALRDEYPVSPEPVWNIARAAVKSFERITLHPDNLRYEVVEPARVTRDQVFGLIYQEIIEELRYNLAVAPDQPVPVFPFAYDWRQPLVDIQRSLADFIEEVVGRTALLRHYAKAGYTPETGKVHLVGHSMGGLIIAGYCKKQGMGRVDKVATIASPFRGSIEAVAKTSIGVAALSLGSGGSREREAARLTPALYHLLPSYEKAVTGAGGAEADIFLPANWQPGVIETIALFIKRHGLQPETAAQRAEGILEELLDQAWKHRSGIERLKLADTSKWLCVAGVGCSTRLDMTLGKDPNGRLVFDFTKEANEWKDSAPSERTGDNTVPFSGARCAFIPPEQMVCVSPGAFGFFELKDRFIDVLGGFHGALPTVNAVQGLVTAHLAGRDFRKRPDGMYPAPGVSTADWRPPVAGLQ